MKNKKGFTLIELLAVIILLSIIALITTPIVLNVVEEAKENARIQSVTGYADAVKLSFIEEELNNTGTSLEELADSKMQGEEVVCEYVKYDDERYGSLLHTCTVSGNGSYCYINGNVYDNDTEECNNVYAIIFSNKIPYNTPNITVISQIPNDTEYAQSKEIKVEYPSLKVVEEHYYIKVSESVEISNVVSSCGTGEYPADCTTATITTLEANTWYEVSGEVTFTATTNLTIESIIGNNNQYGSKATYTVNKIDTSEPVSTVTSVSTTSSKAIVYENCTDTESGITKVEYSINGGEYQSSNIFQNLSSNNKYAFKVRCTNGAGIVKESEATEEIGLSEITAPTIAQYSQTPSNSTYATQRVIRITFNGTNVDNPKYYYSLDGDTWTEVESTTHDVTYTSNGYLYAKTVDDKGNTASAAAYTVTNIDTEAPTVSASLSGKVATFTLKDNIGVVGYGVNQSTEAQPTYTTITQTTSTTGTYTATSAGEYVVWVKDVSGRTSYTSFTIDASAFCAYEIGKTWEYAYTGGTQTFIVPCSGTYKLEVYGAQGADISYEDDDDVKYLGTGGRGGYSSGNVSLTSKTNLYVVIGGQGTAVTHNPEQGDISGGGYNGGGNTSRYYNQWDDEVLGGGGGATHIATGNTNRGVLANYSSYKSEVLIVAGGGGGTYCYGSNTSCEGGAGGGLTGGDGYQYTLYGNTKEGIGGTQTAGGNVNSSFGQGGSGIATGPGGGGYYGGGANGTGPGGGGSGYIGGVTGGSTQNGIREGNGYAKITLVSIGE